MDDFEVVGKIVVDDAGRVTIQGLGDDIDKISTHTGTLSNATSAFGDVARYVWANIVLEGVKAAINAVVDFGKSTIQSAMDSQNVVADLENALRSTGGAVGMTSQELQNMATSLQGVTRFSDETIIRGESMLLTFTSIGKEIFPQATQAMLDLAQKMGSDVSGSAIQLGKALNDPLTGLTALRRVGVQFTDDQKYMIESLVGTGKALDDIKIAQIELTDEQKKAIAAMPENVKATEALRLANVDYNDTQALVLETMADGSGLMQAQQIILNELAKEFGNTAQAAGSTFAGQMEIAKNKLDDVKEVIGAALIPFLGELTSKMVSLTPLIAAFATEFSAEMDKLRTSLATEGLVATIRLAVADLDNAVAKIFLSIGDSVTDWMAGDGPQELSDKIIAFLDSVGTGEVFRSKIAIAASHMFKALGEAIDAVEWGEIAAALDNAIARVIERGDWTASGTAFGNAVEKFFTEGWDFGVEKTAGNIKSTGLSAIGNAIRDFFVGAIGGEEAAAYWASAWQNLIDHIKPIITFGLDDLFSGDLAIMIGKGIVEGIQAGVLWAWGNLMAIFNFLIYGLVDWIKKVLRIESPSGVFFDIAVSIVEGLIAGWNNTFGRFLDAARKGLADVLSVFGIDLDFGGGTIGGVAGGSIGTAKSGTTAGSAVGGTLTRDTGKGVVNNYYYGPVFFGSTGEPGSYYDCPSPNPFLGATYPGVGGLAGAQ